MVVERRDGLASYQLAVVVDDAFQEVTRVVRGADLLPSTPWQIDLQQALVAAPAYLRTPAAVAGTGRRQTIQIRRALPLDPSAAPQALTSTLTHLSQAPPPDWPTPLLKMCGIGHLRTGTRKRLRARRVHLSA